MFDFKNIIDIPPFSLVKQQKDAIFAEGLSDLINHHYLNCSQYHKILEICGFDPNKINDISIPPIPVRLFKDNDLLSVEKNQIIKTMTSSGTSGQGFSKIFLDRETSTNQTKVLIKIISSFTGKKRLPMLIIDTNSVLKDRKMFSARGAGILGFSMLGYDVTYALDEDMKLDISTVEDFCNTYKNGNILIFGFTFMIYEYFYKILAKERTQIRLDNGIMIHGGGWKKLHDVAVTNNQFKNLLDRVCGIKQIYNYYGMVEQTGSIFMECEAGYLHCSIFSDVKVLRNDFSECGIEEKGLIQLSSLLPSSYPGHIILTEDSGEIIGEDDCSCGRLGKYFKVHGRVMDAEIRGCSNTYESI